MFVTFEGPEGAGKSTVLARIADRFREQGREVITTREPGAGDFGAEIRRLLLHGEDMTPPAELFLFLADRAQHVARVIRPALAEGKIVLCDRYADSTLVYQAYARGLDIDFVRAGNAFATGGLVPSLTVLLDLPSAMGLARVRDKDRLDSQPLEFHEKVRAGFLALAAEDPGRWRVVSAEAQPNDVVEAVWSIVARASRPRE
jgi:dTMP kinase